MFSVEFYFDVPSRNNSHPPVNPMIYREIKVDALHCELGQTGCMSKMTEQQFRSRVRYVIGPDGSPLTIADLPPKDTKRWVIRRKAEVVAAVRGGLLSLDEACERYKLTVDEFLSWQQSIEKHGLPGLRATRVQDYRN